MRKATKYLAISQSVKKKVWERDNGMCVLCGTTHAAPCAHIIPRSHGGLGIESNIVTLCERCHLAYDYGENRKEIRNDLVEYMQKFYPDWTEEKNMYDKWRKL